MNLILIVEDDPELRSALNDVLKLRIPNLQVIQAQNGVEGIQLAVDKHPDLVLLDGIMPVLDGYHTAKRLRSSPETRHIPLIAITSEPPGSPIATGMRSLCDIFLAKPFSLQEFNQAMDQVTKKMLQKSRGD